MLACEDMGEEICDPLLALLRELQIGQGIADVGTDRLPIELRAGQGAEPADLISRAMACRSVLFESERPCC